MLDNMMDLVKGQVAKMVGGMDEVPANKRQAAVDATAGSLMDGLKKYATPDAVPERAAPVFTAPVMPAVKPRQKTIRQITQSLPHYFQPQLSSGLTATVQFNITGAESFDGYLTIQSTECAYADGTAMNPDITIIADAEVWGDVMKHRYTAQKAFMIGGLKVRGNFVLLTKFDTLFKLG